MNRKNSGSGGSRLIPQHVFTPKSPCGSKFLNGSWVVLGGSWWFLVVLYYFFPVYCDQNFLNLFFSIVQNKNKTKWRHGYVFG